MKQSRERKYAQIEPSDRSGKSKMLLFHYISRKQFDQYRSSNTENRENVLYSDKTCYYLDNKNEKLK